MPTDDDPAKPGARAGEPSQPDKSAGERRGELDQGVQGASNPSFRDEFRGARALDDAQRAALSDFAVLEKNGTAADRAARALELLGQGVGIVEPSGEIVWMNQGLTRQTPETMRRFADCCVDAIQHWRRVRASVATIRAGFRAGGTWYEVVMTPLRRAGAAGAESADGAVALLVDATATRRIQDRLDAIDAAGVELLQFDADAVRAMNAPERLKALEGRVVSATRSVLGFDHFEYRLTDRRTGQLELVFCSGLVPLGIGERIFARAEGNGLSGVVAATGESIVCQEVAREPRYVRGLPGAASTLTVPLRLHDRVVGVLNAESGEAAHFDDEDRLGAELLGRYVALSLNILDMLVAERCETNRTILANVAKETERPLGEIANDARTLLAQPDAATVAGIAQRLIDNAARVDELLRSASTGPQGVLGADAFMREGCADPMFAGRRVLVADDELSIRSTVRAVLEQQGCIVSEFSDGASAIRAIRERADAGTAFDLVVSDVRMPDANGYEVFRAAKDAHAATPVILMTAFGYDPNHSIVRSSQEGLHCFLGEPCQVSQLLEESHTALAERPA